MKQFISVMNRSDSQLSVDEYLSKSIPYSQCIARGEPFLWRDRIPVIYAFAPESYWRIDMKTHVIYGQAEEIEQYDELEDMLEFRRRGNIFGRWFSKFCRDGEVGYQPYILAEPIEYPEFVKSVEELEYAFTK